MPSIDRTQYNALVDDDGSNTLGTTWTKNIVKTVILDPIDALITALLAAVNTWAAKQTFSAAPMVPASAGTVLFGLDCTDTAVFTLANNASLQLFNNINNFSGLLIIVDTSSSGEVAMFLKGAQLVLVSQTGTLFSAAGGTGSKTNVYRDTGVVIVENKSGGSRDYRVFALRIRTSG